MPEENPVDFALDAAGFRARLDLRITRASPSEARRMVRQCLATWGITGRPRVDDVALVASEMVTGALLNGNRTATLTLELDGDGLTVAVEDGASAVPAQKRSEGAGDSGHALRLIGALSLDWGIAPLPQRGRRVWARLPARD